MKKQWKTSIYSFVVLAISSLCISCSSDDNNESGTFQKDKLINSVWSSSYYDIGDDGETEKGDETLTFTSSSTAEVYAVYTGKQWNDDYTNLKNYSGTYTIYYNYSVSGNTITLIDPDENESTWEYTLSGNSLIRDDKIWTYVKNNPETTDDDLVVNGNPKTGIASWITKPVKSMKRSGSYAEPNTTYFTTNYQYNGRKVTRMARSGENSASYSLSYSNNQVVMNSANSNTVFTLDTSLGYSKNLPNNYYNEYNFDIDYTSNGQISYIRDDSSRTNYVYTYDSNGDIKTITVIDESNNSSTDKYTFTYTSDLNTNGLYPEGSVCFSFIEDLLYTGLLGAPCKHLVKSINFEMPFINWHGTMVFTYNKDESGNIKSYYYSDDPIYKYLMKRTNSPIFSFTY